jgi:hypothetical protein
MLDVLKVLTVVLVAVAMAMSLAHTLELPGKMRLSKEVYVVVQRIYYPGFTIGGGIGEFGGFISTIVLLFFTPRESIAFSLTIVALIGLIGLQLVYWVFIHRVNKVWLQDEKLGRAGSGFFGVGETRNQTEGRTPEWTELRNRWEYAHVTRAGLAAISFIALVIAVSRPE